VNSLLLLTAVPYRNIFVWWKA